MTCTALHFAKSLCCARLEDLPSWMEMHLDLHGSLLPLRREIQRGGGGLGGREGVRGWGGGLKYLFLCSSANLLSHAVVSCRVFVPICGLY